MDISPTMEILAFGLTVLVHIVGGAVLIWQLRDTDGEQAGGSWRDWWPKDDHPTAPLDPVPGGPGVERPVLGDLAPSPVRLREPKHIGDRRQPARRPAHPPVPQPERTPQHTR